MKIPLSEHEEKQIIKSTGFLRSKKLPSLFEEFRDNAKIHLCSSNAIKIKGKWHGVLIEHRAPKDAEESISICVLLLPFDTPENARQHANNLGMELHGATMGIFRI